MREPSRALSLLVVWLFVTVLGRRANAETTVDLVGNIYCRGSEQAGERPWGGVRVTVKGHPTAYGESDPEHGRFRLLVPEDSVFERKLTLVYSQANLRLTEQTFEFTRDELLVIAGRATAHVAPKVFVVPYCVELEAPRLRQMVRALLDRISHRAALVHEELVRAHRFGTPETVACLDDVLNRLDAHLRHAEGRVPKFIDALGEDMLRARHEVTAIKIADERSEELSSEANYCLSHHAPRPVESSSRYLPDLNVSPSGVTFVAPQPASPQGPLEREPPAKSRPKPGEHSVVQAGTALLLGYDSNLQQVNAGRETSGFVVRPLGQFSYKHFDEDRLSQTSETELPAPDFETRLLLQGLLPTATTGDGRSLSQYSDLGGSALIAARLQSSSRWGALVLGSYERRIEPTSDPEYSTTTGLNDLRLAGEGTLSVGEGRFDISGGYGIGGSLYDNQLDAQNNRVQHRFVVHERLRFLPETVLLHETELRMTSYSSPSTVLSDSSQWRSRLGLVGMLGERVGFHVLGGWALSDYAARGATTTDFDGLLLGAKVEWFFGPVAPTVYAESVLKRPSLSLSYDRDYRDHIFTDFYQRDRVAADLTLTDGAQLLGRAFVGVSRVGYPRFLAAQTNSLYLGQYAVTRSDVEYRVDAGVLAQYQLLPGLSVCGLGTLTSNLSDVVLVAPDGSATQETLGFRRLQVQAGLVLMR